VPSPTRDIVIGCVSFSISIFGARSNIVVILRFLNVSTQRNDPGAISLPRLAQNHRRLRILIGAIRASAIAREGAVVWPQECAQHRNCAQAGLLQRNHIRHMRNVYRAFRGRFI
jgi:hypothetical protein